MSFEYSPVNVRAEIASGKLKVGFDINQGFLL
jgi:hypothetical protein